MTVPGAQFYEDLSIMPIRLPSPPISVKFCYPPPPNLHPTSTALFVALFLWLYGWSRHIWCAILLNDIMDPRISSLGTLVVPERPCCVFYATRRQLYFWQITWIFAWTLIWYHTHTPKQKKDTHHTQGSIDCQSHINIQSKTRYFTQTAVFMWNRTQQEKLDFYFSRVFR